MARKQPEVTAATRAKLVAAFWRLYAERPIEKVRVADITGLAGYNRSTFYEYFADVPQILESEEQALVELVEGHAKETDAFDPAQMLSAISEIYEANGDKIALLLGERGDPGFARMFKDALFPAFRELRGAPCDERASLVFEFGISGLLAAFAQWRDDENRMPAEDFAVLMRSVVTSGTVPTLQDL